MVVAEKIVPARQPATASELRRRSKKVLARRVGNREAECVEYRWKDIEDARFFRVNGTARKENAFGLLMSLNMLVEFGDAFDFTGADFKGWCQEVGFKKFEVLPLAGPCSAAIAYK